MDHSGANAQKQQTNRRKQSYVSALRTIIDQDQILFLQYSTNDSVKAESMITFFQISTETFEMLTYSERLVCVKFFKVSLKNIMELL